MSIEGYGGGSSGNPFGQVPGAQSNQMPAGYSGTTSGWQGAPQPQAPQQQPAAQQATQQPSILPSSITNAFAAQQGVAANLGQMTANSTPYAANYLQGLFQPGLNQMNQAALQAGLYNAQYLQNNAQNRLEAQFENSPGATPALYDATRQLNMDTTNNALGAAAQMGIAQNQLAAQNVSLPFQLTQNFADVAPTAATNLFNLANTAQNQALTLPLSVYSQEPVITPTVATQQPSNGGGLFGK